MERHFVEQKTSEKAIEGYLVKRVKEVCGKAYKWVSPGNAGVPDRIVVFRSGRIIFVELKTARGKLTPLQNLKIKELLSMGCDVRIVRSKEEVDSLVKEGGIRSEV